jgi:hypothetical protein
MKRNTWDRALPEMSHAEPLITLPVKVSMPNKP